MDACHNQVDALVDLLIEKGSPEVLDKFIESLEASEMKHVADAVKEQRTAIFGNESKS